MKIVYLPQRLFAEIAMKINPENHIKNRPMVYLVYANSLLVSMEEDAECLMVPEDYQTKHSAYLTLQELTTWIAENSRNPIRQVEAA